MKINTTEKTVTIDTGSYKSTYPLNTLSYQITDNGVSILQGSSCIETAPIVSTTVNGEQLTLQNTDELLSPLFASNQNDSTNNLALPIQIGDVRGLPEELEKIVTTVVLSQDEFDALASRNPNTLYYVY